MHTAFRKLSEMPRSKLIRLVTPILRLSLLSFATMAVCCAQDERKPVENPSPVYPPLARQLRLTGTVRVKAVVSPDGTVKHAEVVGGHPVLADAALDAIKRWRYAPAKTETPIELEFRFRP
jgi:TonB family protein